MHLIACSFVKYIYCDIKISIIVVNSHRDTLWILIKCSKCTLFNFIFIIQSDKKLYFSISIDTLYKISGSEYLIIKLRIYSSSSS